MGNLLGDMSKSDKTKWLFTILLTLIVVLIPAGGLYTEKMKLFMILTVFSLSVIAFEFMPTSVMAILLPVLYIVTGIAPVSAVMAPWLGETIYVVIGCFLFAAILTDSGFLTRVAYFLMAKVNGSYAKLLVAIFLVGVMITFATFGLGYMVMAPLCAGLCLSMGQMKTKFGAGVAMSCILGTCAARSFTYPASAYGVIGGIAGDLAAETFANLNVVQIIFHNSPMFFVALLMVILISKWYKPDFELKDTSYFNEQLAALGEMTMKEKKIVVFLLLVIGYTIISGFVGWNVNWGLLVLPWLCFFPGVKCADQNTFRFMNWEMVFFAAGCMSIGTVAATLGFGDILATVISGVFNDNGIFATFGLVYAIIFVLNLLMTPMAIWSLLTIPLMQVALANGMDPLPFVYCLVGCSDAVIFPYEYVPYLTVYAFGMMSMGDFIKLNVVRCVLHLLTFMVILIPFWMMLGII